MILSFWGRQAWNNGRFRGGVFGIALLAFGAIVLGATTPLHAKEIDDVEALEKEIVDRFCALDGRLHEMTFDEIDAHMHEGLNPDPALREELDEQSLNQAILEACPQVLIQLSQR